MKKVLKSLFAVAAIAGFASGVSAQVAGQAVIGCTGETATLSVFASTSAADAGRPGAWYIAAHHPDDFTRVAFLTPGGWQAPDAGGFIPYSVHRDGIPATLGVQACVPPGMYDESGNMTPLLSGCSSSSQHLAGYIVKVGYGVLTLMGEQLVNSRRERLEAARPLLEERGKWRADHADDEHMRESLVLKSLREDGRVADFLVVPAVSCYSSGG